ncbi:MAG: glycosyltransferase family 87 protein [Gemmataceae bacterium]
MPRPRWPLLVPVVWAAAVLAVIRPDAVTARGETPFVLKWLLYDESDLTAFAVRGANLAMGRLPGRPDEPAWRDPPDLLAALDDPPAVYSDRFYLEYPVPVAWLFRLAFVGKDVSLPPVLADGHHTATGWHAPRTDAERAVWTQLGNAVRVYVVLFAAATVALMLVLRAGYGPGLSPGPALWLTALPGAVYFGLHRFDVLPALATAVGFALLGRGRVFWAGFACGVGAVLKVYPVLFAPVVVRHLGWKRGAAWAGGFAAAVGLGAVVSVLSTDWAGAVTPIRLQFGREPELTNWVLYGRLLPTWLAYSSAGRLAILGAVLLGVVWNRPADLAAVLRRCGLVLVVFVNLAVFWSPQWVVWFLPLVVPLAGADRRLRWPAAAVDVLNYLSFPVMFWIGWNTLPDGVKVYCVEGLILVRTAAWGWLAWRLLRPTGADPTAFPTERAGLLEAFRRAASAGGSARGLRWVAVEPNGEPLVVRDGKTGEWVGLLPTVVRFEPEPGSDLEDVPQAREPRPVTAVFVCDGVTWTPTGKAVFNLSPEQYVAKDGGRFAP